MSEFRRIGDVFGSESERVWPPENPAPGVQFAPRRDRDGRTYITPVITDPRAYYNAIALRSFAQVPEDEQECGSCHGLRYVNVTREISDERFGRYFQCPNYNAQQKRCLGAKRAEPWWNE